MAERLEASPGSAATLVYFARGIDGLDSAQVTSVGDQLRKELSQHGLTVVDPVAEQLEEQSTREPFRIVTADLELLRRCHVVLMDMSIPSRNYVGCCCELVYAYLWHIPV